MKSFAGKQVLIVERDDDLLRSITSAVRSVGCVVAEIGRQPGASVWRANSDVDAAIVDVDTGNLSTILLIEYLSDRGIPILLITDSKQEGLPRDLQQHAQVGSAFTQAQLLERLARIWGVP